jgi:regulator of protease activity HflC (stomatin/prohibitin superfamily)
MHRLAGSIAVLFIVAIVSGIGWLAGSSNPRTPAGYVGYVTQGAVFGKTQYLGTQLGPTSYGRTWLADVTNVSITPFTYDETFNGESAVLSKDSLRISFAVHIIWRVKSEADQVKEFVEKYTTLRSSTDPDLIVKTAYDNFLKEPLRTSARNEIQIFEALKIKDNIVEIGKIVQHQMRDLCTNTPFEIMSVVVGNIQYPETVANAVADKMAATQRLEQAEINVQIEKKKAEQRIAEANGIAKAMEIINQRLSLLYLQHEAIEAQKAMIGSPNHTTIYIPVGPMGVPIVGTIPLEKPASTTREPKQP